MSIATILPVSLPVNPPASPRVIPRVSQQVTPVSHRVNPQANRQCVLLANQLVDPQVSQLRSQPGIHQLNQVVNLVHNPLRCLPSPRGSLLVNHQADPAQGQVSNQLDGPLGNQ